MTKENGMVMMTEKELEEIKSKIVKEYEKRIDFMHKAILELSKETEPHKDTRVTKTDFLAIYQKALDYMWDHAEDNDIYGYDFTVHWHGIYCNCSDGATPSNYLIPGIEGCNLEDPYEL